MSQHLVVEIIGMRERCTQRCLAPQLWIVFDFGHTLELEYLADLIEAVSLQIEVHLQSLPAQYVVVGGYGRINEGLQLPQHGLLAEEMEKKRKELELGGDWAVGDGLTCSPLIYQVSFVGTLE